MSVKIEIPESHLNTLKKLYELRLEEIDKDAAKLQKEKEDLLSLIKEIQRPALSMPTKDDEFSLEFENNSSKLLPGKDGYISGWPWWKKIKFIIEKKGRALNVKEIAGYLIFEYEPELKVEQKKVIATISGQLSNYIKKDKVFNRAQNELDEYIYDIKK